MINSTPGLICLGILLLLEAFIAWRLIRGVEKLPETATRGRVFRRSVLAALLIIGELAAGVPLLFLIADKLG